MSATPPPVDARVPVPWAAGPEGMRATQARRASRKRLGPKVRLGFIAVIAVLARVAATGAADQVSVDAFESLGDEADGALGTWFRETPPPGLKSFDRRWHAAILAAIDVRDSNSYYGVTDLRAMRPQVVRCLAALERAGATQRAGLCFHIALDLDRGLWVGLT